jgi:hypothetical protein
MVHNRGIMAIDWAVIKADYLLHHELTLTTLAEKYAVSLNSLSDIASREHWAEERNARSARIYEKAFAVAEINQVKELADFNSECLRQAKMFVGTINFSLTQHNKPNEIRSLASALESAQRIGRLCLGAAVETTQQIPAEFDVDAARERLYNAMLEAEEERDPSLQ